MELLLPIFLMVFGPGFICCQVNFSSLKWWQAIRLPLSLAVEVSVWSYTTQMKQTLKLAMAQDNMKHKNKETKELNKRKGKWMIVFWGLVYHNRRLCQSPKRLLDIGSSPTPPPTFSFIGDSALSFQGQKSCMAGPSFWPNLCLPYHRSS